MVFTWDALAKKRIGQVGRFPTGVAALDFSADGALLAVASSYTYEEGEKECVLSFGFVSCPLVNLLFSFCAGGTAVTRPTPSSSTACPTPWSSPRVDGKGGRCSWFPARMPVRGIAVK